MEKDAKNIKKAAQSLEDAIGAADEATRAAVAQDLFANCTIQTILLPFPSCVNDIIDRKVFARLAFLKSNNPAPNQFRFTCSQSHRSISLDPGDC